MFKAFVAITAIVSTIWFGGLKDEISPSTPANTGGISQLAGAAAESQKNLNDILGGSENQKHLKNGLSGNINPSK